MRGPGLPLCGGRLDPRRPADPARAPGTGRRGSGAFLSGPLWCRQRIDVAVVARGPRAGGLARAHLPGEHVPRRDSRVRPCRTHPVRRAAMNSPDLDLSACDREPIHIPGSIQPHGLLLVVDSGTGTVTHAAGDVEDRLGTADWQGAPLQNLLGRDAASALLTPDPASLRNFAPPRAGEAFDVRSLPGPHETLIELEPAAPAEQMATLLPMLEEAAQKFEKARDMADLMAAAAREFRRLTGFDRVMVYRFLDDDAGKVVAEDAAPGQHSYMNHHFPASDIPAQARDLYVRNLVRVIP